MLLRRFNISLLSALLLLLPSLFSFSAPSFLPLRLLLTFLLLLEQLLGRNGGGEQNVSDKESALPNPLPPLRMR